MSKPGRMFARDARVTSWAGSAGDERPLEARVELDSSVSEPDVENAPGSVATPFCVGLSQCG